MNIRADMHEKICQGLSNLYRAKNTDYGNSFVKVRQEYPNAVLIRLSDKLERLKSLYEADKQLVTDESIEDTLKDLANYCLMEIIERRIDSNKHIRTIVYEQED